MSEKLTEYNMSAFVKPVYPHAHLPLLTPADVPDTILMTTLYRALRVKRDHGTMTEARFVAWLCNRLPVTMIDGAGNVHVDLRTQPSHRTMFTSHTDTVHTNGGDNAIRLDTSNPAKVVWRADAGSCLGADDGAGIAIMCHMIDKRVPGLYVFFRGEECGGLGSSYMDSNFYTCLKDIDRCVSFDRADTGDVITHQGVGRCCSDVFADALAAALTTDDMSLAFFPDATGVFTDSANLVDHIPECTNLSVGYKSQHGDGEWQDVTFLAQLADQVCVVAWDDLPTARDPKLKERYDAWGSTTMGALEGYVSPGVDETTEYLIEALWEATEDDYASLRGIVSEWINPEKPEESLRLINPRTLWASDYEKYAEGLMQGSLFYAGVLDELVDFLVGN